MKIVLIRPPKAQLENAPSVSPHPPLGLSLIAGILKSKGHDVKLIDAAAKDIIHPFQGQLKLKKKKNSKYKIVLRGLRVEDIIADIPPDVEAIGISSMFTTDWISDRDLIGHLGEKFPQAFIFIGGEHATAVPEICLEQSPHLKYVVAGEGEETACELIDAVENNKPIAKIFGLIYKDDQGVIHTNPRRTRVVDIEKIPYPAWDDLDLSLYPKHFSETHMVSLPILATRGCPFQCTFCSSPAMWGTRYYMRSPESVLNEMKRNMELFHTNCFDFFDLTAIIKKQWVIDFAKLVKEEGVQINWRIPAGTRSEAIDEEVSKALYDSGCKFIVYAPESGSVELLKKINKKVKLDNMKESIFYALKNKMVVYINVMIGLPEETFKDQLYTIRLLIQMAYMGIHDLGLSYYRFYPGSEIFNGFVKEQKIDPHHDDYIVENIINLNRFIQVNTYETKAKRYRNTAMSVLYLLIFYFTMLIFHPKLFKRIYKYGTAYRYFERMKVDLTS